VTANGDYTVFCWAQLTKGGAATFWSTGVQSVTVAGCDSDCVEVGPGQRCGIAMRFLGLRQQHIYAHVLCFRPQLHLKGTLGMPMW
jgi:hypothetical protein